MLTEFWERVRGYDKWVPVEATIKTVEVTEEEIRAGRGGLGHTLVRKSRNLLVWFDQQGSRHAALFMVEEGSRLYKIEGEKRIRISYNPANPDEYYFHELFAANARKQFGLFLLVLAAILVTIFVAWLRS